MTRRPVLPLRPAVANRIAAGEVVSRPASVVKELIENAIDAEASRITVSIEAGGLQSVRVVDDGFGMGPEDAVRALERHATSKITEADDLLALASFGFRGEALPSIASVSRFRLRTRPAEAEAGTEVLVEGGAEPVVKPCGGAPGTSVEVEELFFNVPARRKFVRGASTESANVGDVLKRTALAHHEVGLELVRDGRRSLRWLSAPSREERVRDVLKSYDLHAIRGHRGPLDVEAYLTGPDRTRTGAGGLYLFVLGRPVQDRALARAIATAYGDAIPPGKYPIGAIFLDLPSTLVDVNVHPQKAEVRFAQARAVTQALHGIVRDAMASQAPPSAEPAASWKRPAAAPEAEWQWPTRAPAPEAPLVAHERPDGPAAPTRPVAPAPFPSPPARAAATERPATARLCGIAQGTLLLVETPEGLRIVPRARGRAAVLAAWGAREWDDGGLVAQRLLFPLVRSVEPAEADRLEAAAARATRHGCDLRRVGPGSVAVHAVPRLFAGAPHEPLVSAILDGLGKERPPLERFAELAAASVGGDDEALVRGLADEGLLSSVGHAVPWSTVDDDG